MKKVKKGNYGYIRYERKKRLLVTLVMFAIPLVIYVTGYIQTKTRLNLFTFVAILGCLPASRSMVGQIMIFMQKPVGQEQYEREQKAAGSLLAGYEMIFTAYEHTTLVTALVICGAHVVCHTMDDKMDPASLEKHISRLLAANGFSDAQVKVLKDEKTYLQRVADLNRKQEQLRGTEMDPNHPTWTYEEGIYQTLLAICL